MDRGPPSRLERRLVGLFAKAVFVRGRRRTPPEKPKHPPSQEVVIEGDVGQRLVARWFPVERPRGVVVLAHPDTRWAKDWFVQRGWIDFIHEAGLEALAFDFTGYGASEGPATYPLDDVLAATRFAQAGSGFLPVHVVGVSYGACAVANAAPRLSGVKSIVLESPFPNLNIWFRDRLRRLAMDVFDRAFPKTSRFAQADENIAHALPERILFCLAEEDETTPPALTEAVARRAPQERTTLLRVPGASHLEPFTTSEEYRQALLKTWLV
ncbi:MAG TPA: alpha/beta fold hydrolase [Candidatus Thermoplasmatota archaeon]|nr:alpha/beta fold hydrolase [Candidatus Thermoplasmatota archaeon]